MARHRTAGISSTIRGRRSARRWRDADITLLYLGNGDGSGRFLSILNVVFRPAPAGG